ncbi:MAG: porin family protein [Candidatus Azobacteroides sp.]|nr:porin family protein [Candidatus Azobacteroides sp.]
MKKIIFFAVAVLFAVSAVNAQEFKKGDWAVNAGISINDTDPLTFGGSIEYGIVDNLFKLNGLTLGVGAEVGYASKSVSGVTVSASAVGIRIPFHYSPISKLDLYTAPALLFATASVAGFSANTTDFGWTIIGARYFFTPNIGVFAELGSNNALGMAVGVSFKF